jgi:Putative transposase/Transposase zinc-binding domain
VIACRSGVSERPRLEVADVFRRWGEAYREQHALSPEQARAMRAIELCRTAALGGHLDVCDHGGGYGCGYERPSYNSCRNRHCPKCQSLAQAAWVEKRKERILPINYFHVVFTLPEELRPLALNNRDLVFGLLFAAASATLLDLGHDERRRLCALLGFTAVLHTWTRALAFHPHLHTIVTGGGLSDDGERWKGVHGGRYLFPVRVLSGLFRGKFLAGLKAAREHGDLRFTGTSATLSDNGLFRVLLDKLYGKEWVVYAKRPFGGAEQVFRYLGLYTHRVGLANSRLLAIDEGGVRFSTKDGESVRLRPFEFIRRFLLHVLPPSFVKIRHYGLLAAANVKTKLVRARGLLEVPAPQFEPATAPMLEPTPVDWVGWVRLLTGRDPLRCPRCQVGILVPVPLAPNPRPPPASGGIS